MAMTWVAWLRGINVGGHKRVAMADKIATLDRDQFAPDGFAFGDRVIYLRLPNGLAGSRLPNWNRLLGCAVTVRNWNTVTRVHQLAG